MDLVNNTRPVYINVVLRVVSQVAIMNGLDWVSLRSLSDGQVRYGIESLDGWSMFQVQTVFVVFIFSLR